MLIRGSASVHTKLVYQVSDICASSEKRAPAEINSNESAKKSCKLPPYPENGGYVVVEEPNARPGDVFDNISLVQYVNADEEHLVELKNFVCTAGRWSLKIYKYESEKMYFNTSWCRLFESSALIRQWTESRGRTSLVECFKQRFRSSAGTCTLPPYPAGGSYTVVNKPNAVPGNVFESAHLLYSCSKRRVLYGNKDVYCFNNAWSSKTPNCVKCGVSTAGTEIAVAKGRPANPKEITWQVAIYDKNFKPFKHICGGSVIASNLVISGMCTVLILEELANNCVLILKTFFQKRFPVATLQRRDWWFCDGFNNDIVFSSSSGILKKFDTLTLQCL
ncbi:hypothetical protein EVAR_5208_1 [Eumeta japonica]|uniref:Sushi domain-containing protein n=1 Tax=Eumeta variegata TaxID=151549 RepID=A0A4C1V5G7_EUMVA|nr:hypothetical protein EVAR_5208_1 [Eumeta japonica]